MGERTCPNGPESVKIMNGLKRLPDSELDVMLTIWEAKRPVTRMEIEEGLRKRGNRSELAPTTILTFLTRLIDKGFLTLEKHGKTNVYTAVVPEEEYLKFESKNFLGKLYGGSAKAFLASLCGDGSINGDELAELRNFLNSTREEDFK